MSRGSFVLARTSRRPERSNALVMKTALRESSFLLNRCFPGLAGKEVVGGSLLVPEGELAGNGPRLPEKGEVRIAFQVAQESGAFPI